MRIDYDHIDDALYVTLIPVEAVTSIEIAAGVLADYDAEGQLIGLLGPACSCCVWVGDWDHSGTVDVGDVTYLVAYLFVSGPPAPCSVEADIDGSGSLDVGDLTFLIAYLFAGGGPPIPCP